MNKMDSIFEEIFGDFKFGREVKMCFWKRQYRAKYQYAYNTEALTPNAETKFFKWGAFAYHVGSGRIAKAEHFKTRREAKARSLEWYFAMQEKDLGTIL